MTARLMRRLYTGLQKRGVGRTSAHLTRATATYTTTQSRLCETQRFARSGTSARFVAVEIQTRGEHVRACRVVDHDTSNKDGSSGFIQCHGSSVALAGLGGSAKRAAPRFRPSSANRSPENDVVAVGKLTGGNHGYCRQTRLHLFDLYRSHFESWLRHRSRPSGSRSNFRRRCVPRFNVPPTAIDSVSWLTATDTPLLVELLSPKSLTRLPFLRRRISQPSTDFPAVSMRVSARRPRRCLRGCRTRLKAPGRSVSAPRATIVPAPCCIPGRQPAPRRRRATATVPSRLSRTSALAEPSGESSKDAGHNVRPVFASSLTTANAVPFADVNFPATISVAVLRIQDERVGFTRARQNRLPQFLSLCADLARR